jgi:hypothetical protein
MAPGVCVGPHWGAEHVASSPRMVHAGVLPPAQRRVAAGALARWRWRRRRARASAAAARLALALRVRWPLSLANFFFFVRSTVPRLLLSAPGGRTGWWHWAGQRRARNTQQMLQASTQ